MTQSNLDRLLDAMLPHVAFDGWSQTALDAAVEELELTADQVAMIAPRGAIDVAIAYHQRGDSKMVDLFREAEIGHLRYSQKVALAIWLRLEAAEDREAVRRGSTLFALPIYAADGAKLIWGTADAIWTTLGDSSDDLNWYTKRATLSAVYSSVVLFWLGDTSMGAEDTRTFIDRRIENVMQFEKFKSRVNGNPLFKPLTGPLEALASRIKAPARMTRSDLPGMWR